MESYELRDRRASATPGSRAGPAAYELDIDPDKKGPSANVSDVKYPEGPGAEGSSDGNDPAPVVGQVGEVNELKRGLHGRHMQMIAIGKSVYLSRDVSEKKKKSYALLSSVLEVSTMLWLTLMQVVLLVLVFSSVLVVLSTLEVLALSLSVLSSSGE